METTVLVELIGVVALGILCLVSAISSWQTRRFLIAVFGENPGPAQLTQRGYYVRLPDQVPPAAPPAAARPGSSGAALGSSDARALAPAVEPATVAPGAPAAPAASPGESFKSPSPRPAEPAGLATEEPAPETKPKPGTVPSSRMRPAVTAPDDLVTLARDLDSSDQAQAGQVPERRVPIEGAQHKPPHFVRKATIQGNVPPSVAPPRSLPLATADDFESDDEATKVMDLPTAEDLALDKHARSGRAKTLVSEFTGVPSSARREPDVKVVGADTPSKPGDTPAPVVVR